jgi:hypothetical protein
MSIFNPESPEHRYATGKTDQFQFLAEINAEPTSLNPSAYPALINYGETARGRRRKSPAILHPDDAIALHAFTEFLKRAGPAPNWKQIEENWPITRRLRWNYLRTKERGG